MATIKSIEEKAKAYDEAKYIMKEYLESGNAGVIAENTIKKAFPELAESEDERIRKALLLYIRNRNDAVVKEDIGIDRKDVISWLEKQGEQKYNWSEEDKNNILFLTAIIEECFKGKEKITLYGDTECAHFTKEDVIERLKSLSPQNTWKPSDEQLDVLHDAAVYVDKSMFPYPKGILMKLYKQLKKL